MKTICVFCGSRLGSNPEFASAAHDLGKYLGENKINLVYGGSDCGLMGILADSVLKYGSKVIAVMPEDLLKKCGHKAGTKLTIVKNMAERKQKMLDLSDAFIVLPGGLGTLDEIFEMLTYKQLGYHDKPCGFLNVHGYFNHIWDFIENASIYGFVEPEHIESILFASGIKDVMAHLESQVTTRHMARQKQLNKVYAPEKGLEVLLKMVKDKLMKSEGPVIINIAGGVASGKTSFVIPIIKSLVNQEVSVIAMDDYYRGNDFIEEQLKIGSSVNWDQPQAINLKLLKEHLGLLRNNQPIQKPIYDFKINEAVSTEEIKPNKIIIVEGLFTLRSELCDYDSIKVFISGTTHGRTIRRLIRDVTRKGFSPVDILEYQTEVSEPMYKIHIEPTLINADLIIDNDYQAIEESARIESKEITLRFPYRVDMDVIGVLGAKKLETNSQSISYYEPQNHRITGNDELVFIREKNNKKILTYKGPKSAYHFPERSKLEFEVSDQLLKKFLILYNKNIRVINKQQTIYQLDNIIFSINSIGGLGDFLEIKVSDRESIDINQLEKFLDKFSLKLSESIKKTYCDMSLDSNGFVV